MINADLIKKIGDAILKILLAILGAILAAFGIHKGCEAYTRNKAMKKAIRKNNGTRGNKK